MGSQGAVTDPTLPCIWMTAGVLAYRLCDRQYDCDRCPLDAALRGAVRPQPGEPAEGAGLTFPADRHYHRGHGWIRPDDDGTVLFGVDALAARLLAPAGSIVLPAEGAELTEGGAACWVREDGEMIPVQAPVSGVVLAVNTEAQQDPSLLLHSPYDRGWLLRIRLSHPGSAHADLVDGAEAARRANDVLSRIRDRAVREAADATLMGVTLADGGDVLLGLRRVLGAERYARLIGEALG
jgi:glycine cleavage system H protein